jgi:adenylosuccinate synthase
VRLGVGYRAGNATYDISPVGAEAMQSCEPIYEEMPGWSETTVGIKRYQDLPANARRYLQRMEEVCETPVDMISTGPDREETIVLRHPFEV